VPAPLHRQPWQRRAQRHWHRAARRALRPLALRPHQRPSRRWHQPLPVRHEWHRQLGCRASGHDPHRGNRRPRLALHPNPWQHLSPAPVREPGKARRGKDRQKLLPSAQGVGWDAQATPWSGRIAVLVTSLDEEAFPTQVIPKHYRDRADAEYRFDELKSQWGWNDYTSRRLASSWLIANLVALFYNWWNLYPRFYDEDHHRETISPLMLACFGNVRWEASWTREGSGQTISPTIRMKPTVNRLDVHGLNELSIGERWMISRDSRPSFRVEVPEI
jgi:hypothetical protein